MGDEKPKGTIWLWDTQLLSGWAGEGLLHSARPTCGRGFKKPTTAHKIYQLERGRCLVYPTPAKPTNLPQLGRGAGSSLCWGCPPPSSVSAGRAPSCRSVLGKVSSLPEGHPPRRLSTHPLCLFLPPQSFGRLALFFVCLSAVSHLKEGMARVLTALPGPARLAHGT